jgi:hypothetical protein
VSDFFEPPPRPPAPAPQRHRTPPWLGPPDGTLPGIVPLDLVLARTDRVAVCAGSASVYPAGFELEVVAMSGADTYEVDPLLFGERAGGRASSEALRIGIQFADGSKATNMGGFPHGGERPAGPVLSPRGGGGGGGSWRQTFWVWPLPAAGPLVLACEWPAHDIPLTRHEIDAQAILDAAQRAQVVFSEERLPEWPPDDCAV